MPSLPPTLPIPKAQSKGSPERIPNAQSPAMRLHFQPGATLTPPFVGQISESSSYSPDVKKVVDLGLHLTAQNLGYKYNSDDPARGGMDCSGFIYYVLTNSGIKNVPRDAREQYVWVRKAGNFRAVLAQRDDTFELDELKPGDLLFWASSYGSSRDPDISQTMIYLGREKGANQRIMIGAGERLVYKGQSRSGVNVFDFKVERAKAKSNSEPGPVFVGYGRAPGVSGK
jgi:peptidoglycan DL-endopeptidase CwlO